MDLSTDSETGLTHLVAVLDELLGDLNELLKLLGHFGDGRKSGCGG